MNPLASVVIPTYKRPAAFVKRAVDSVLRQTYSPLEVIVVDDNPPGSPERAVIRQLMRDYEGDGRVHYVQNEKNLGGSLARNQGIAAARGEYLAFLDDDDEFLPEKLQRQIDYMQKTGVDMSLTAWQLVDDAGRRLDFRTFDDLSGLSRQELLHYHLLHHLTGTGTFVYKAEALKRIGGFEPAAMGQEFYLMLRTIEQGLTVGYFPECHIVAHQHDCGRISQGEGKVKGENALFEFKKKYFDGMTAAQRRYVRFRHYAVLTVVHMRDKRYPAMLGAALKMLCASPADALREGARFFKNRAGAPQGTQSGPSAAA